MAKQKYDNQITVWVICPKDIAWLEREKKRIDQYQKTEIKTNKKGEKALFYVEGFWEAHPGSENKLIWHKNKHKSNN